MGIKEKHRDPIIDSAIKNVHVPQKLWSLRIAAWCIKPQNQAID